MFSAALCGSDLAGEDNEEFIWGKIQGAAAFEDSILTKADVHFIVI